MMAVVLVTFLNLFVPVFCGILLVRIILSYIVQPGNRFMEWLMGMTEPILAPIRKVLPATGGVDFAPLAAILLLQALSSFANSLIPG